MTTITKQNGITLVEVLITLLVLAVGLVGLTKLQIATIRHGAMAKQQIEAVNLAQKKIEELRNYEALNTQAGKQAYDDITTGTQTLTKSNVNYNTSWNVVDSLNHKAINITISWSDQNNVTKTVNLTSIISKTDPAESGSIFLS